MKKQTKLGLMGLTAVVAALPATHSSENTHVVEMNNYTEANEIETGSVSESETLTSTSAKFTGVYDTKEEANVVATKKEEEYKNSGYTDIKSSITEIESTYKTGNVLEFLENELEQTREVEDLTKEEADELKATETDTKNLTIVVEVEYSHAAKVDEEEVKETKICTTEQEALDYIAGLEADATLHVTITKTENTTETPRTLNVEHVTKAEAESALNNFMSNENYYDKNSNGVQQNTVSDTTASNNNITKEEADTLKATETTTDELIITVTVEPTDAAKVDEEEVKETKICTTEQEALDYIAGLEADATLHVTITKTENTTETPRTLNVEHVTKAEAESALNNFMSNENYYDKNSNGVQQNTLSDTTASNNNITKEEADALKATETTTDELIITVTVEPTDAAKVDEEEVKETKICTTEQEALDYIAGLEKDATLHVTITKKENTTPTTVTFAEENTTTIFGTRDEALQALANFKGNDTVEEGEITENKLADTTTTETVATGVSKEEADRYKNQEIDNHDKTVTVTISDGYQTVDQTDTKTINESALTEKQKDEFIKSLQEQGYDTSRLTIKTSTSTENITSETISDIIANDGSLDNGKYTYRHLDIDATNKVVIEKEDGTTAEVTGNIKLTKVVLNGSEVKMNTTATPDGSRTEFRSKSMNMNFGNNSTVQVTGTLTYTYNGKTYTKELNVIGILNESKNQCPGSGYSRGYDMGFNEIKVDKDGNVIVSTSTVTLYSVTGTATKTTYKTVYDVTKTTNIHNYNYTVSSEKTVDVPNGTYTVTVNGTKDIMEDRYNASVRTQRFDYSVSAEAKEDVPNGTYTVTVNGTKDIMEDRYKAVITTTTREFRYEDEEATETLYFLSMTGKKDNTKEMVAVPQTGEFDYTALLGTGIILSGAAVAANRRKKENN